MGRRPICLPHQYALKAHPLIAALLRNICAQPCSPLQSAHTTPEATVSSCFPRLMRSASLSTLNLLAWSAGDAALLTVSAPGGRLAAKELLASASGAEVLKSCDCRAAPVLSSYISIHTMYVAYPGISPPILPQHITEKPARPFCNQVMPSEVPLAAACLSHVNIEQSTPCSYSCSFGLPVHVAICPGRARHVPNSQVPLGRCMHSQEHRGATAGPSQQDHTGGERRRCHGRCLPGSWKAA